MALASNIAELARAELLSNQAEFRRKADDPTRWAYQDAAAVLVRFNPDVLHPATGRGEGWSGFSHDSEPVRTKDAGGDWTLRPDVRRAALRRLGTIQAMRKARAANDGPVGDPHQRLFDKLLAGARPDPESMSREELGYLITTLDWLGSIAVVDLDVDEIRRRLPVADLLAPMKRLANRSFVGRERELQQLRDYVGINSTFSWKGTSWRFSGDNVHDFSSRPPLMIAGAGGVGKSTLLARFILQHVERAGPNALPFVYLDIDRPLLQPEQPTTLLAEIARQLAIQWPAHADALEHIGGHADTLIASYDRLESTKVGSDAHDVVDELGNAVRTRNDRPILLVIDTFEEAQYLGPDVVRNIWSVLINLQEQLPLLRTVICGRSSLQGEVEPIEEIVLGDLELKDAVELLRLEFGTSQRVPNAALKELAALVGTNPMSLKLAAAVVREQGLEALSDIETRAQVMIRATSETVQARLYGRMLAHLHGDNLQTLVYPGLVVRRITPEVVEEVLAQPCGIDLTATSAAVLVHALSREKAFIDTDPGDGALVYRQDVRRAMLRDIVSHVAPATLSTIHSNAVNFYERQSGLQARAEELYHRLMRRDAPLDLEPRWVQGVERYLRTALEELPARSQLWLAPRLGVTPRAELRGQASLEEWESVTATAVQRLLDNGDTRSALAVLEERADRSAASPLWRLESESHRLARDIPRALATADRGIEAASRAGQTATVRTLLRQRALIREGIDEFAAALADVDRALQLEYAGDWQGDRLRLLTTRIRLLRKLGPDHDSARREAIDQLKSMLTPEAVASLDQSPVLLNEIVAEIGAIDRLILTKGLDVLGLNVRNEDQAAELADALLAWDVQLGSTGDAVGELSKRAGLERSNPYTWSEFVTSMPSRRLANTIVNWRDSMSTQPGVEKAIVGLYRDAVDATLTRPVRLESQARRRPRASDDATLR